VAPLVAVCGVVDRIGRSARRDVLRAARGAPWPLRWLPAAWWVDGTGSTAGGASGYQGRTAAPPVAACGVVGGWNRQRGGGAAGYQMPHRGPSVFAGGEKILHEWGHAVFGRSGQNFFDPGGGCKESTRTRHTCTRAPKRPAFSAAHAAIFYPVFMPNRTPALRSVTRSNLSPAWMSTTLSRLHLRQYSDTHAAAVSGYSRMSFPDLHTGHGTNTPYGVDLHKTTALPFMENSSFPGQPSRACASREKAPRDFMLGNLRFLFKRFPPFSLPLFLKLYLITSK